MNGEYFVEMQRIRFASCFLVGFLSLSSVFFCGRWIWRVIYWIRLIALRETNQFALKTIRNSYWDFHFFTFYDIAKSAAFAINKWIHRKFGVTQDISPEEMEVGWSLCAHLRCAKKKTLHRRPAAPRKPFSISKSASKYHATSKISNSCLFFSKQWN